MDREFTQLEAAWLSAEAIADQARRDAENAAAEAEKLQYTGAKDGETIKVLLTSARARHEEAEKVASAAFDKLWTARESGATNTARAA